LLEFDVWIEPSHVRHQPDFSLSNPRRNRSRPVAPIWPGIPAGAILKNDFAAEGQFGSDLNGFGKDK
jgi:hypothetical protein